MHVLFGTDLSWHNDEFIRYCFQTNDFTILCVLYTVWGRIEAHLFENKHPSMENPSGYNDAYPYAHKITHKRYQSTCQTCIFVTKKSHHWHKDHSNRTHFRSWTLLRMLHQDEADNDQQHQRQTNVEHCECRRLIDLEHKSGLELFLVAGVYISVTNACL